MYSKVKPLLSDAPLRMEALLVRSLMEELRAEICRRDEALAAQLRSNMMAAPLDMLTSAQGTAAYMDAIWALLSEKGYITPEDALKSDPIGRACVYMQSHLSEKLTVQELAEYVHISPAAFYPEIPDRDEREIYGLSGPHPCSGGNSTAGGWSGCQIHSGGGRV